MSIVTQQGGSVQIVVGILIAGGMYKDGAFGIEHLEATVAKRLKTA